MDEGQGRPAPAADAGVRLSDGSQTPSRRQRVEGCSQSQGKGRSRNPGEDRSGSKRTRLRRFPPGAVAVGRCRSLHRSGRMVAEPFLKDADDWLTNSGERGLWPGHRTDSVDDLVGLRIDEHFEELLTVLRVVRQRSVGEAAPSDTIRATDTVENAATVQGPEPEVPDQNCHDGSRRSRRVPREGFHPADIELFPRHQGGSSRSKSATPCPIATVA